MQFPLFDWSVPKKNDLVAAHNITHRFYNNMYEHFIVRIHCEKSQFSLLELIIHQTNPIKIYEFVLVIFIIILVDSVQFTCDVGLSM